MSENLKRALLRAGRALLAGLIPLIVAVVAANYVEIVRELVKNEAVAGLAIIAIGAIIQAADKYYRDRKTS